MASFTKVNDFVVNLANAMDLDSDTLKVALCNTDPNDYQITNTISKREQGK